MSSNKQHGGSKEAGDGSQKQHYEERVGRPGGRRVLVERS